MCLCLYLRVPVLYIYVFAVATYFENLKKNLKKLGNGSKAERSTGWAILM